MSPPVRAQLREIRAEIFDETFDDLTRALRGGDRDTAIELLARRLPPHSGHQRVHRIQLTLWVREEIRLHIESGRFQHALALVERYSTLPVPLNQPDATALARRLGL